MVIPEMIQQGQEAMQAGNLLEGASLVFHIRQSARRWGVCRRGPMDRWPRFLIRPDEPGKENFKRIDRLQAMKTSAPKSEYTPWALCAMGDVYWDAGWYSEASGLFEEFLRTYPEHPLAGGVMVEAGLGFLKNRSISGGRTDAPTGGGGTEVEGTSRKGRTGTG